MRLVYHATYRDPLTGNKFGRRFQKYNRKQAYAAADEYAEQMDCDLVSFKLVGRV